MFSYYSLLKTEAHQSNANNEDSRRRDFVENCAMEAETTKFDTTDNEIVGAGFIFIEIRPLQSE